MFDKILNSNMKIKAILYLNISLTFDVKFYLYIFLD